MRLHALLPSLQPSLPDSPTNAITRMRTHANAHGRTRTHIHLTSSEMKVFGAGEDSVFGSQLDSIVERVVGAVRVGSMQALAEAVATSADGCVWVWVGGWVSVCGHVGQQVCVGGCVGVWVGGWVGG